MKEKKLERLRRMEELALKDLSRKGKLAPKPKETEVDAVFMDITPELAYKWLEGPQHNRTIRDALVARFSEDMRAGRWLVTHQGVAFNSGNKLIDGQHRLWAIIASGATVKMMVTRNVEDQAQLVIDTGGTRTAADSVTLTGEFGKVTGDDTAVLRGMMQGFGHKRALSNGEIRDLLGQHLGAIREVKEMMSGCAPKGVGAAVIRSAIVRATYTQDKERLRHFCRVLVSGIAEEAIDSVIIKLRDQIHRRGELRGPHKYARTERALMAWLMNDNISVLYEAEAELFPLPGEKKVSPRILEPGRRKRRAAKAS